MQALTFQGIAQIRYESVPDPRLLHEGDAIVQVERAGLCGSDLHVYHGRDAGQDVGTIMGHELVGRIVEAGPAARRHAIGTRNGVSFEGDWVWHFKDWLDRRWINRYRHISSAANKRADP